MAEPLVSDEQLAEWEALAEAATEGPWDTSIERYDPVIVREGSNWPHGDDDAHATAYSLADAQFIAASRAAVPALVRALRDARDEAAREPIRTAIEYDHWRNAAIANRNEADSLRAAIEHALEDMGSSTLGAHILRAALAAPTGQSDQTRVHNSSITAECGCARCDSERRARLPWPERMCAPFIVCPDCGDKRCPRAAWHGNTCQSVSTGDEETT